MPMPNSVPRASPSNVQFAGSDEALGRSAADRGIRGPPKYIAVSACLLKCEQASVLGHQARTISPARSEAIRCLVELGLTVKTRAAEARSSAPREMAVTAIDKMTYTAATTDDQATRKKRLSESRLTKPKT